MSANSDHREDPRRARSRSKLLDAAAALLRSGGIEAVTIDAVTRASTVARTTLYRHFDDSAALVTAAFEKLLPPVTGAPPAGPARERLIALLDEVAAAIDDAPLHLTTLGWLAIGPGRPDGPDQSVDSLRTRVIAQYREPLDALLDDPEVRAEIGARDHTLAMLQLAGPLVFARLLGLPAPTAPQRAALVDDFLAGGRVETGGRVEIRSETPADADAIGRVTTSAFAGAEHSSGTEAAIIDALRDSGALTVSLVAHDGPEIVGHIAFSPVTVDGRDTGWFGLGPVSVLPDAQGRGTGAALIRAGLARLTDAGAAGCVLLGDPGYYRRFGFRHQEDLHYPDGPAEYFLALPLCGPAAQGTVTYHDGFGAH